MNIEDYVGPGCVQDLVATLVSFKILKSWLAILQHCAHRTISNHDTCIQRLKQRACSLGQLDLLELMQ